MKRRILIIEAHDPTLFLLTFILERDGCEVLAARDSADALEIARRAHPHLVVIGRAVTGADRLDVARHLREDGGLAHTPVVAMVDTAHDTGNVARAGCTGWVETPIIPARLRTQLAAYLDGAPDGVSPQQAPAGATAASA